MNQNTIQLLFALVRSAIRGNQLSEQERASYRSDMLPDLMMLSKRHDIAHLVAEGLNANGLLSEENKEVGNEIIKAIYRHAQLSYEYVMLCNALEKAHIPFIPLKGSVLRQWYPEPWMRTSCDIDILVHEKDVQKAADFLITQYEYSLAGKGSHDISLFSKGKIHIELHYDLIENAFANTSSDVLRSVWDSTVVCDGCTYRHEMTDEMFYFYHIAHMAKHFLLGGCGIRSFIDLWILERLDGLNMEKRNVLLAEGGLLRFADAARQLSRVWLDNEEHTEITEWIEKYILYGGTYGSSKNKITIEKARNTNSFAYALKRMFLPYQTMILYYPVLKKVPILLPFCWFHRIFKMLIHGKYGNALAEMKTANDVSDNEIEMMQKMRSRLGL